jgi:hypothetical protein
MHKIGEAIRLSASDLVGHLNCRHLTEPDLAVANGKLSKPRICPAIFDREVTMSVWQKLKKFFHNRWVPPVCAALFLALAGSGEWLAELTDGRWLAASLLIWTLAAVSLATLFYWLRRKWRLSYGLLEMLVAFAVFYVWMLGAIPGALVLSTYPEEVGLRMLPIFAAIYVMVLGLESVGAGLNPSTNFGRRWNAAFPQKIRIKRKK